MLLIINKYNNSALGHKHPSHPEIVKRLKRADGRLYKIINMIEEGNPALV